MSNVFMLRRKSVLTTCALIEIQKYKFDNKILSSHNNKIVRHIEILHTN